MDKAEDLMAHYPQLMYKFEPLMPAKQKGLIINNVVYLNPEQSHAELSSTVAEEIGHHLTSVGNIVDQDTIEKRKQEQKARDIGAMMVVTPEDIIECYKEGFSEVWECAEFLEITKEAMQNAVDVYHKTYGRWLCCENYSIEFKENGTLKVWEN